jgi:hypothetical protein
MAKRNRVESVRNYDLIRRAKFRELYLTGPEGIRGNARQAARAAGYSDATAQNSAHKMAARERIAIGDSLRNHGLDETAITKKLKFLLHAKTPKYNPGTKDFEIFEDGDIQLRTAQELSKLLDLYPAPKTDEDMRPVTVNFPKGGFSALLALHGGDDGGISDNQRPESPRIEAPSTSDADG